MRLRRRAILRHTADDEMPPFGPGTRKKADVEIPDMFATLLYLKNAAHARFRSARA